MSSNSTSTVDIRANIQKMVGYLSHINCGRKAYHLTCSRKSDEKVLQEYNTVHAPHTKTRLIESERAFFRRIDDIHTLFVQEPFVDHTLVLRNSPSAKRDPVLKLTTESVTFQEIRGMEPLMFPNNNWKGKPLEVFITRPSHSPISYTLPLRMLSEDQMRKHFQPTGHFGKMQKDGTFSGHLVSIAPVFVALAPFVVIPIDWELNVEMIIEVKLKHNLADVELQDEINLRIRHVAAAIGVEADRNAQFLDNILLFRRFSNLSGMFDPTQIRFYVGRSSGISEITLKCGSFEAVLPGSSYSAFFGSKLHSNRGFGVFVVSNISQFANRTVSTSKPLSQSRDLIQQKLAT